LYKGATLLNDRFLQDCIIDCYRIWYCNWDD